MRRSRPASRRQARRVGRHMSTGVVRSGLGVVQENMEQMAQYSKEMRQAVVLRETLDGRQTPDRALTEATITLGGKAINSGRARTMLHQCAPVLLQKIENEVQSQRKIKKKAAPQPTPRPVVACPARPSYHTSAAIGCCDAQPLLRPGASPIHQTVIRDCIGGVSALDHRPGFARAIDWAPWSCMCTRTLEVWLHRTNLGL